MARDSVCGMTVQEEGGLRVAYQGQTFFFCSELCKRLFQEDPGKYMPLRAPSTGLSMEQERSIAYFSMEIAIDSRIPTYAGGLGILAGDTLQILCRLEGADHRGHIVV